MQGSSSVARTTVDAAAIEDSVKRLDGVAVRTPLQRNLRLSERTGAQVWLKREDLQIGRSYKLRGAYNLIAQLDDAAKAAGVVCASAGNHGQGLAYSCHILGVQGKVYVPRTTPRQKRDRIAALGGKQVKVIVTGDTYDDAAAAALAEVQATGATMVPAFDDPRTVAGQGTVAVELVEQLGQAPTYSWFPLVAAVSLQGLQRGSSTGIPAYASSGSSRAARRAWRQRSRPVRR